MPAGARADVEGGGAQDGLAVDEADACGGLAGVEGLGEDAAESVRQDGTGPSCEIRTIAIQRLSFVAPSRLSELLQTRVSSR
jgi:hypothetical protein